MSGKRTCKCEIIVPQLRALEKKHGGVKTRTHHYPIPCQCMRCGKFWGKAKAPARPAGSSL